MRVIAGVVVAVATVHANQLADTTLAVVTVHPLVVAIYFIHSVAVESATSIYPSVHADNDTRFDQLLVSNAPFVVKREVL